MTTPAPSCRPYRLRKAVGAITMIGILVLATGILVFLALLCGIGGLEIDPC